MKILALCSFICICLQCTSGISLSFQRLSSLYLPYTYDPSPKYALGEDAAEQMAYDSKKRILYSVGELCASFYLCVSVYLRC